MTNNSTINTYYELDNVSSKDPLSYDPMLGWYTAATLSGLLLLFIVCVGVEKIKDKILSLFEKHGNKDDVDSIDDPQLIPMVSADVVEMRPLSSFPLSENQKPPSEISDPKIYENTKRIHPNHINDNRSNMKSIGNQMYSQSSLNSPKATFECDPTIDFISQASPQKTKNNRPKPSKQDTQNSSLSVHSTSKTSITSHQSPTAFEKPSSRQITRETSQLDKKTLS